MDQNALKRRAAEAALAFVEENTVLGVGTGSTVNCFIDLIGERRIPLKGAVSSSKATEAKLRAQHQGRKVDFDIVIKDGKAVIKPKLT